MSSDSKRMNLVAHRVVYTDDTKVTFEEILEQLKQQLPNHEDRVFEALNSTDTSIAISKFLGHPSNTGIGAVISAFQRDAEISTLAFKESSEELGFNTQPAAEGEEYLDQNFLLFAVEDIVISCGIGKRKSSLASAIYHLATRAGIIPHTTSFNFTNLPRGDVLESIRTHGVKEIDFDATVLIGSLPRSLKGNVLNALFGSTSMGDALKRRRENVAKLKVKNSRFWQRAKLGIEEQDKNEWLSEVAEEVVNDDELHSYTIILNNDTPIKSGTLMLNKVVVVAKDGTSFDVQQAHAEMVTFYREVKRGMQSSNAF
ncbi:MAG: hypothetical protein JXQ85_12745 [Cognatishimia sp.]|uniref:hypothetical protein n=1 Tax=Cognatishimia sp. TaxID=2211648 RepID=UPI003B8B5728